MARLSQGLVTSDIATIPRRSRNRKQVECGIVYKKAKNLSWLLYFLVRFADSWASCCGLLFLPTAWQRVMEHHLN